MKPIESINAVTRARVLEVISECKDKGEAAFLKEHGYRKSLRYQLQHGGKSFPSKAILGVSAGLSPKQFSGGASHTVRVLGRLGFTVRDAKRKPVSSAMVALVALAASAWPFPALATPSLDIEPAAVFASGSNHAGEIRGWASIGQDIGVAAPEVNEAAIVELEALAGSDIAVFVDSGAFSEVNFTEAGPVVVKPITDAEWRKRLALYKRLARSLAGQLHVVAPDRVGDQTLTLARLDRYKTELREIAALGAHILVPTQKGALSQGDFFREARALLRIHVIPAFP
jgi:hypothetical protein